jgi:DNA topoisomerase I
MATLKLVSAELNNTPAVCRRSYIHPRVIDSYLSGDLQERWTAASARGSSWLSAEERKLLVVLADSATVCAN